MGCRTYSQYIYINLYIHIWRIAKIWLNFLLDDFEKDLKNFKKRSRKSLM